MTTVWRIIIVAMTGLALARPALAQDTTLDPNQATLRLSAVLAGASSPAHLTGGLRWRVFGARAGADGQYPLAAESSLAEPILAVPPGDYVVHVAFGLATAAKRITLGTEVRSEQVAIAGGALRIVGVRGDQPIDPAKLALSIFVPVGKNPEGKLVTSRAHAGDIVGLPEGGYHVVSTILDTGGVTAASPAQQALGKSAVPVTATATPTNSIVSGDIKVTSGKIVDVTLRHRCATLTLKLVSAPGSGALANTSFTVLTPGGDLIRELLGAFPSLVLAEGEYVVIARHDQKTYQSTFQVQSGLDRDVEVIAQESGKQGP